MSNQQLAGLSARLWADLCDEIENIASPTIERPVQFGLNPAHRNGISGIGSSAINISAASGALGHRTLSGSRGTPMTATEQHGRTRITSELEPLIGVLPWLIRLRSSVAKSSVFFRG
jgi:hypothetical protein